MDGVLYTIDKLGVALAQTEQQLALAQEHIAVLQDRLQAYEPDGPVKGPNEEPPPPICNACHQPLAHPNGLAEPAVCVNPTCERGPAPAKRKTRP